MPPTAVQKDHQRFAQDQLLERRGRVRRLQPFNYGFLSDALGMKSNVLALPAHHVLLPQQPLQPWPQTGSDMLSMQCVDAALNSDNGGGSSRDENSDSASASIFRLVANHSMGGASIARNSNNRTDRINARVHEQHQQQRVWDAHGSSGDATPTPPFLSHIFVLNPFRLASDPHVDTMLGSVIRALAHAYRSTGSASSATSAAQSPPTQRRLTVEVIAITTTLANNLNSPSAFSSFASSTPHNISDQMIEEMIQSHLNSTMASDAARDAVKRSIKVLPVLNPFRTAEDAL